jgi:hypothetical protein
MKRLHVARVRPFLIFPLWLLLVGIGAARFLTYENTAGSPTDPPLRWPKDSLLATASGRPTLTMFLHPQCPCSRASMTELTEVLARNQGRIDCNLVFFAPDKMTKDWVQSDLYRSAEHVPGAKVFLDREGREAARFKAVTSGTVVLYDAAGRLRFHGGVTLSRGHQGDNPGRQSLLSLISTGNASHSETPVFGCPLTPTTDFGLERLR